MSCWGPGWKACWHCAMNVLMALPWLPWQPKRYSQSMTDLSYSLLSAGCNAKLSTLGHWTPSTVSCILGKVTSPVRLPARPIRRRPGWVSTNQSWARFKWPGRAVGAVASYVCNVRSGAAATNYRERVRPTSRAYTLTLLMLFILILVIIVFPRVSQIMCRIALHLNCNCEPYFCVHV